MPYVDITRAILETLAAVYPRGIQADALASMVSCEDAALRKALWILQITGAVSNSSSAEVRITEAARRLLKQSCQAPVRCGSAMHM